MTEPKTSAAYRMSNWQRATDAVVPDPVTPAQIATLERLTNVQNNLAIPLTNDERDQMHALLRWLKWYSLPPSAYAKLDEASVEILDTPKTPDTP